MMMPANYSVIAENEMTYVNGGAFIDCLAPVMEDANWKKFNTNLIMIIGNSFMQNFVDSTLGVIFGGEYTLGAVTTGIWNKLYGMSVSGGKVSALGVLNSGLQILGGLASIYALGQGALSPASKVFEV